jgi:hypothetical protein
MPGHSSLLLQDNVTHSISELQRGSTVRLHKTIRTGLPLSGLDLWTLEYESRYEAGRHNPRPDLSAQVMSPMYLLLCAVALQLLFYSYTTCTSISDMKCSTLTNRAVNFTFCFSSSDSIMVTGREVCNEQASLSYAAYSMPLYRINHDFYVNIPANYS